MSNVKEKYSMLLKDIKFKLDEVQAEHISSTMCSNDRIMLEEPIVSEKDQI